MKKKAICQAFGALLAPLSAGPAGAAGLYLPQTYLRAYRNASSHAGNPYLAPSSAHSPLTYVVNKPALASVDGLAVEALELRQGRAVRELIIVDADVPEQERFRLVQRHGVDVVELPGERDALDETIAVLSRYRDLDEIHLVSHGEPGALRLGDRRVDAAMLEANPRFLNAFNRASRAGADLLLYGCNVAAGDGALLDIVRRQTHLDVAASNDATGAASMGGDWDLEIKKGRIEAEPVFSERALRDYAHVLGPAVGTFTFDSWSFNQYGASVYYAKDGLKAYSTGPFDGFMYAGGFVDSLHVHSYADLTAAAKFFLASDDGTEFGAVSVDVAGYYSTEVELIGYRDGAVVGRKSVPGLTMYGAGYTTVDLTSGLSSGSFASVDAVRFSAPYAAPYGGGVGIDNLAIVAPSAPPTVTDGNISISGASGTGGTYRIGDTVTATWNNTAGGDNNSAISSVTIDFSQFGGGSAVAATNSSGTWTATYTLVSGAIDAAGRNVSVTATSAGGSTTTADTTGATVDTVAPTITDANISLSGASGTGGAYVVGDTVTATWNNTAGGDNNSDTISSVTVDFTQLGGGAAAAASNSAGTWTATYTIVAGAIDAANRNVSVTATDNAGIATTTADTTNVTMDNTAPTVTDPNISISGASGAGGAYIVGDTVTATWNNTAGGDNNSDTIAGVTVDFTQFGGGAAVAASNSAGTWTATYTIVAGAINAANRNVSVTASDNAGNATAAADTSNATVDNGAPAAPGTPDLASGSDSGSSSSDNITNDTTPTFTGAAEANSTVTVISSVDGTLGTTTADGSGNWSFTPGSAVGNATHAITASARDAAGNTSASSGALPVTVDTTGPAAPSTPDLAASSDTGSSSTDDVTSDATPTLTGTAEANSTVTIVSDQSGTLGTTTVDGSGNWSFTAGTLSDAVHGLTATSSDTAGNTSAASAPLSVTIDTTDPTASDDAATTDEDNSVAVNVLANDSDAGSSLNAASVTVVGAPANGSTSVNTGNGVITYTPDADFNGFDTFTYTVDDLLAGTSAPATVTITVDPVNDAPDAAGDTASTDEDTPALIDVAANDSDRDSGDGVDAATIVIVTPPADGAAVVESGEVRYTPDADFVGTDGFTYTIEDGNGAVSNPASVVINISGLNDAPRTADDTANTDEDVAVIVGVLGNDSDIDGVLDPTSVQVLDAPAHGTTSVDAGTGEISYTPEADFNGADSFTYTVRDDADASAAAATVTVTVAGVNDVPVAANDVVIIQEDVAHDINVLGNDSDVDGDTDIDPASVEIVTPPAEGAATVDAATGSITYTPGADFNGADAFTYRMADQAGEWSAPATVALTVESINDAPLANDDGATTAEDTAVTIDVLANDDDVDGTLDPASVTIVAEPALGEAVVALDGSVTYTPGADANGSDHFSYTVADDGGAASGEAEVTVTVTAVNDAPTITGTPPASVAAGAVYHFTPTISDPDGDALTVSAVNLPPWLVLDQDTGALDGMPGNMHVGEHGGIGLTVSDGTAEASLPAFSILVEGALDSDGDGMPDDYELGQAFDPFDPADGGFDADGDGVTNSDEYLADSDPLRDDYAPLIEAPETVSLNATGLLTPFPALDAPAASDDHDGAVDTTLMEPPSWLEPGRYELTWRAGDAAGNQAEVAQILDVHPLISLAPDQVRAEGGTAQVRFLLNGTAPDYPFSVGYAVDGTADAADHDLVTGVVTFEAGQTETALAVHLVDDGAPEGSETVRVTLTGEGNFSAHDVHVLTIVEENVAPAVTLSIVQNGRDVRLVTADGGPVTFTAAVDDPNPGDGHEVDWEFPSGTTVTAVGDDQRILEPTLLAGGVHAVRVVVRDDGTPALVGETSESFLLVATAPVLSATTDSDGDGIDDAAEGDGDGDGDGQPDYLDSVHLANVLNEHAGDGGRYLIEAEPGLVLTLGAAARADGGDGAGLTLGEAAEAGIPADGIENVGGYFDFVVRGLETAGAAASVVIPQREPVPENPVYRKFDDAWHDFVEDQSNSLASARGAAGVCPAPGSDEYAPGLRPGDWCVRVTIGDGGPNDADGAANRAIEDPGGVGAIASVTYTTEVSGGGALGWPAVFVLLGAAGLRRRRAASAAPIAALLLTATVAMAPLEARAAEWAFDWNSLYVTGDLGYAHADVSAADLEAAFANLGTEVSVVSVDDQRTAWGVAAGYRLSDRWALEAGWLDLGDIDMRFDALQTATVPAAVSPSSGAGYTVSALYRHRLGGHLALRARVGLLSWEADYLTRALEEPVAEHDRSGSDLLYAVGAEHAFSERWLLSLELQRYDFDPEPVHVIAVGVEWRPWRGDGGR